jgi:uncharacterized membrane protein YhaH (DUF805 family)
MNWYLTAMRNYANFDGRARRKEYWYFILFNTIFAILAVILDNVLGLPNVTEGFSPLYSIYWLATLVPGLAVTVRRLHDTGRSGWYFLVALIPLIGGIWLLVMTIMDGDRYTNQYGPDPKEAELSIFR